MRPSLSTTPNSLFSIGKRVTEKADCDENARETDRATLRETKEREKAGTAAAAAAEEKTEERGIEDGEAAPIAVGLALRSLRCRSDDLEGSRFDATSGGAKKEKEREKKSRLPSPTLVLRLLFYRHPEYYCRFG